jgi:hypothetical protein
MARLSYEQKIGDLALLEAPSLPEGVGGCEKRFSRKGKQLVRAVQPQIGKNNATPSSMWTFVFFALLVCMVSRCLVAEHRRQAAPRVRETKPAPATSAVSEVWVNTRSGKYWKPGSRFYGETKEGEFMSELDALDRGYSPAGGTGQ